MPEDVLQELKNRKAEIDRRMAAPVIDDQEMSERQEAAEAYLGEDESHFVDYVRDCIDTSTNARKDVREEQAYFWQVFNEEAPESYEGKEAWQAKTIMPRPFAAVHYGVAAVKKAFSPDFLTVDVPGDPQAEFFWKRVMDRQLDQLHSNFTLTFTDAVTMALAVGESMEMIPRWSAKGLKFDLVEPWKIHRDPDAPPRDAQGGMYWIHQEWMDFFILRQGEENGKYFDVKRIKDMSEDPDDALMTKDAISERKKQVWERSKYRTMCLVSEFWGILLDKKGDMLMPSATLTVAGNRVIQQPMPVPYKTLRWPGVMFSPLPSLLAVGGSGLLRRSVVSVWESMCNLLCLHQDGLNWIINPTKEINVDALEDPDDVEDWPGKKYLVRDTVAGQQAIRQTMARDNTSSVLANLQYEEQLFQQGSMISDAVQGLPGYRQDMTYREAAMQLDQSLGVFSLMGLNIELGAIQAISAAADVIRTYAGLTDMEKMITPEEMMQTGIMVGSDAEGNVTGIPEMDGAFHVSGLSNLMKDAETLRNLRGLVVPLVNDPRLGKYIQPFSLLKALETRINLTDENVFVPPEIGQPIEQMELEQMLQGMAGAAAGGSPGGGGMMPPGPAGGPAGPPAGMPGPPMDMGGEGPPEGYPV